MLFLCASGPSYGVTEQSKGIIWISPVFQLCSMPHCQKIKHIWDDFLLTKYGPQRSNLQQNHAFLVLENKVKQLVDVAKQHQLTQILGKCKEIGLGHLLMEMNDAGIEIEENENE
eukprot:UN09384